MADMIDRATNPELFVIYAFLVVVSIIAGAVFLMAFRAERHGSRRLTRAARPSTDTSAHRRDLWA